MATRRARCSRWSYKSHLGDFHDMTCRGRAPGVIQVNCIVAKGKGQSTYGVVCDAYNENFRKNKRKVAEAKTLAQAKGKAQKMVSKL